MKKILFGITNLSFGGAERVLIDLVNCLSETYEITIFTIYGKGELEPQLSPKVTLKSLYDKSYLELSKFQKQITVPLKILLLRHRIYRQKIQGDYDIEIAFLEGPITRLFSTKNKNTRKIAWVHNDMSLVFGQGIKAKIKRWIDKKIYAKYEKLVFVSYDNLEKFKQLYPDLKNEKTVIYNYIDKDMVIEKAKEEVPEKFDEKVTNIVTVARLVEQKGIDRLIEVHKRLIQEGLLHNFYVIGDGPQKEKLQELIKEGEVEATFKLLGKKGNPYPYIKMADYFALLSWYEGYPMVLLEAQILQKDIIITNTAARETLQNYKNYAIAENSQEGILETLRKILINQSKEKEVQEEYQNQDILEKIKKLIENEERK